MGKQSVESDTVLDNMAVVTSTLEEMHTETAGTVMECMVVELSLLKEDN